MYYQTVCPTDRLLLGQHNGADEECCRRRERRRHLQLPQKEQEPDRSSQPAQEKAKLFGQLLSKLSYAAKKIPKSFGTAAKPEISDV